MQTWTPVSDISQGVSPLGLWANPKAKVVAVEQFQIERFPSAFRLPVP
jgi:hypothetical protein